MAKNRADEYRQRAEECLEMARTLSLGIKRTVLTDMAQTWRELANQQDRSSDLSDRPASLPATEQPAVQQQQQIQPDDKKE